MSSKLAPLTLERVQQYLDQEELNYEVEEDGVIVFPYGSFIVWMAFVENQLEFASSWQGIFPSSERKTAETFIEKWNADNSTDQISLQADPEGDGLLVCTNGALSAEAVSDEVLDQFFAEQMTLAIRLCQQLDQDFPQFA
ncbi:hypothetical protein BK816_00620 [Boudabousia tangfeifanii]|uniref:YbjN domain-containing protein n=1 Tax=Boudabousia tangfeifanii TaxID=1912795 RepID=A0A1D9MIF6_9ACTO|nr:YbjN domain-containing protein [Boudabousia tangfeifanii]AOZ71979.1 hypothetical protein BK816_00620 [Boudabousia tangfeifanii]